MTHLFTKNSESLLEGKEDSSLVHHSLCLYSNKNWLLHTGFLKIFLIYPQLSFDFKFLFT